MVEAVKEAKVVEEEMVVRVGTGKVANSVVEAEMVVMEVKVVLEEWAAPVEMGAMLLLDARSIMEDCLL